MAKLTDADIIAADFADELAEYGAEGVGIVFDGRKLKYGGVFSDDHFSVLAAAMIDGFAQGTGASPYKVLQDDLNELRLARGGK